MLCALPPGLPHHHARFGDGDQRLAVSHWSNGGTVYIPGTPRSLCRRMGLREVGKEGPGSLRGKDVTRFLLTPGVFLRCPCSLCGEFG